VALGLVEGGLFEEVEGSELMVVEHGLDGALEVTHPFEEVEYVQLPQQLLTAALVPLRARHAATVAEQLQEIEGALCYEVPKIVFFESFLLFIVLVQNPPQVYLERETVVDTYHKKTESNRPKESSNIGKDFIKLLIGAGDLY
jgi:hypothetical protein